MEVKFMVTEISEIENPFNKSYRKCEELCRKLSSKESFRMSHGEAERFIQSEGMEVLKQMLQDHLNLRSEREEKAKAVVGVDGICRDSIKLGQKRQLESIFGTVIVSRIGYGKEAHASVYPMDAELNLPPDKYSHGIQRVGSLSAAKNSYDETIESVDKYTGGHLPKRQAEELMQKVVRDFDAFYEQPIFSQPMSEPLLILSMDAKGIVMRKEDLREQTRRAAEKKCHKQNKHLSKGEKRASKRMATVASVYSIAPYARTPTMIAKEWYPNDEKVKRPKPVGKRVWASVEKPVETIVKEMFMEALHQDFQKQKQWIALVDGNKTQIRLLKQQSKKMNIKLTIIVDIIHVLEYLWKAVYVFYPEGSKIAEEWVSEKLFRILQGKCSLMAANMRRQATRAKLSKKQREPVDKCAKYLLNNKEYLRYHHYLNQGYSIATGVIEGACRYLIKDRMDRTGARWSLKGAEAVLKLRSLMSSGDFDAYWKFHERQEHIRHYNGIQKIFTTQELFNKTNLNYDYNLRKVA